MNEIPVSYELGAIGVMAGILTFLIRWITGQFTNTIKELAKTVKENQNSTNEALGATAESVRTSAIGHSRLILGLQKQLLMHDATVRGVNPTTGDDADERMQQAIIHYDKLLEMLRGQEKILSREEH